jgi:LysM domain-containing protein
MRNPLATLFAAVAALAAFTPGDARGFVHVVKPGETLAQIAGKVYGNPRLEGVLAGANALDAQGGSVIVPGFRLEIPAPSYHRVRAGETWYDLALAWLGHKDRADVLARLANNGVAWIPPVQGQEIMVPPVIAHIAGENETITDVATKYLPDPTRAWELNNYNFREGERLKHGEIVLVPLLNLALSEEGKAEARGAEERERSEAGGDTLSAQKRVELELPPLLNDLRYGRYAEVLARGNRLIGTGVLTHPQLAIVNRALLEAYVAFDAASAAEAACAQWRLNDPSPRLDVNLVSPKIRAACGVK